MTQVSIDHQVNPRFVPGDVPLWLGNARDSAIIYDATANELTLQTKNASAALTDRIRVESGTGAPFVELVAGRLRLLDAAADPAAAGEITRNGADLKVYSGGAVVSLSNIGTMSNLLEDTTPQLGGDLASNGNDIILADNDKLLLGDVTAKASLYFDGADTVFNLKEAGSGDLMIALAGSFPSPDPGAVHIWGGSAGVVSATDGNSQLILENDASVYLQFLTPNTNVSGLRFGDPEDDDNGIFRYDHTTPRFVTIIGGVSRLAYSAAAFAFQEATAISTSVGDLTLDPTGNVDLNSNDLLNVGAAGNDWSANSLSLVNSNSGGNVRLQVTNTSNTASSNAIVLIDLGGSSGGDAYLITDTGAAGGSWSTGVDNSNGDAYVVSRAGALGANDAFRITAATPPVITYNTTHPTGTFDYVCEGCGDHRGSSFECCGAVSWHDDQLAVFQFLNGLPGSYGHMVKLGVMEYDSDEYPAYLAKRATPWRGWNPWQSQIYTWSMIGQERMRSEFYNHRAELVLDWHEHRLNEHELFTETVLGDHRERLLALEQGLADARAEMAVIRG